METKNNRALWITVAVAAVIAIALTVTLVVSLRGGGKDSEETATPGVEGSQAEEASGVDSEDKPGAMIDNEQRQWPDPYGMIDDSPHKDPGTYSVDYLYQRPVWTPVNHDGDLPAKDDLADGMDACKDPESIKLDGKTQQQYVNARYLAVNDQAGPTAMTDGVPSGYAHTPQGAVLATMNMTAYGSPGQNDGVGLANEKALWSTSKSAQRERARMGEPAKDIQENSRTNLTPPANAFSVNECSDNVVVVEVAFDDGAEAPGDVAIMTVPMIWKNGDWHADLSGSADEQGYREQDNRDGFSEVKYE